MEYKFNHDIGEVVYFQPTINKIKWDHDKEKYLVGDDAIPVKVIGISLMAHKVFYDIALPNGEGGYYESRPMFRVDSYFIHKADSITEGEA